MKQELEEWLNGHTEASSELLSKRISAAPYDAESSGAFLVAPLTALSADEYIQPVHGSSSAADGMTLVLNDDLTTDSTGEIPVLIVGADTPEPDEKEREPDSDTAAQPDDASAENGSDAGFAAAHVVPDIVLKIDDITDETKAPLTAAAGNHDAQPDDSEARLNESGEENTAASAKPQGESCAPEAESAPLADDPPDITPAAEYAQEDLPVPEQDAAIQPVDAELYEELPDTEVRFDEYLPSVDIDQDDAESHAADNGGADESPHADDADASEAAERKSGDGIFSGFLHAAMGDDTRLDHSSRSDRDIRFSQKLHEVIRIRKDKAARLRDEENAARAAQKRRQTVLSAMMLILLAAVIAFIALRYISSRSLRSMMDTGDAMYREGSYSAAQAVYQDAHRRYPDSAEALTGLARAAAMAGDAEAAGRAWLRYLDMIPAEDSAGRAQALYELAQIHVRLGRTSEAVSTLVKATQLSPNYDVYMMLGHMLEESGRTQDALRAYSMAIELRPMSQEARAAAGRVLSLIVVMSDVRREMQTAFENRIEAGSIALSLGRWEDAAACFSEAISISEDDERPWLGLSAAYASLERPSDAAEIMHRALRRFPDSATVRVRAEELDRLSGVD